jgi:hypothetical protein
MALGGMVLVSGIAGILAAGGFSWGKRRREFFRLPLFNQRQVDWPLMNKAGGQIFLLASFPAPRARLSAGLLL